MTVVAIYTRVSADPTGAQTATARQLAGCKAFAAVRDWGVGPIYEDVDYSAYEPAVVRPDYEQMLTDIHAARFDGLLAWKLDRLVRRPADFERLWSTCEKNGVFLASAMEPIDTSTDMGLALVRVLVAFASLESATIGVRLRSKDKERAEQGARHTGAACYGYKKLPATAMRRGGRSCTRSRPLTSGRLQRMSERRCKRFPARSMKMRGGHRLPWRAEAAWAFSTISGRGDSGSAQRVPNASRRFTVASDAASTGA